MADKKKAVQEYYDEFADVYEVKHGVKCAGQAHNFKNYYEPFLYDALPANSRILELGCGTGFYTRWMLDHGHTVVAMDISSQIIAQAKQRCPDAVFVQGDCEKPGDVLPETEIAEGFDVVIGINTFSYYPNKQESISRYKALLRRPGRIVLIDMNGQCPYYRMMTWIDKNEIGTWFPEVRQSNVSNLSAMAKACGMKISKSDHFAFIPNGLGRKSVALLNPFDKILKKTPIANEYAMRLGLVAEVS